MTTIIRFPGAALTGSTDPDPNHHLALGDVSFTCTSCSKIATVNFHNMVFRTLEFYCISCGHPFRISNPAFVVSPKK